MHLVKRLLLVVVAGLSLLVALFGLFRFLVEVGESPLRYVVQDGAVFAAGVLGMWLCWRQGRKLEARRLAAVEASIIFKGHSLEAYAQPWKQALGLVFCGLLAGVCYLMFDESGDWRAALCGAFFALLFVLLVPMIASHYRGGRPTLRLDVRGMDHAWFGQVPWSEVHGLSVQVQTFRNVSVTRLVVGVSDPMRYRARIPWVVRLLTEQWSSPAGRFGTLVVPLQPLDKEPRLVVAAAEALRDRVDPPRLLHWHPSFDQETIAVCLESDYLGLNPDRLPEHELLQRMQDLQPRLEAMTRRLLPGR